MGFSKTNYGRRNVFENNLFIGTHKGLPEGGEAVAEMPPLQGPLQPLEGLEPLEHFRPRAGSDFPRGVLIEGHRGRDFFGMALPPDGPPRIGAADVPAH